MKHRAVCALVLLPGLASAQGIEPRAELDRSKPVPAKSEIISAWRKRQDAIKTFRLAWTEQQTHPTKWLSNPRYPERERTALPGLHVDRSFVVAKTVAVD